MRGIGIDVGENNFATIKNLDGLVRESLKRILLTRVGERPGHLDFGIGLQKYVFSPMSYVSSNEFREAIKTKIEMYEPRIFVTRLDFETTDVNSIRMILGYIIKDEYWEKENEGEQFLDIMFRGDK